MVHSNPFTQNPIIASSTFPKTITIMNSSSIPETISVRISSSEPQHQPFLTAINVEANTSVNNGKQGASTTTSLLHGTSQSPSTQSKKRVRFTDVHVRYHKVVYGPTDSWKPRTLSAKVIQEETFSVEKYCNMKSSKDQKKKMIAKQQKFFTARNLMETMKTIMVNLNLSKNDN